MTDYDEFSMFADNAAEAGLPWSGPPSVRRVSIALPSKLSLSALLWGTSDPELVLLHGGAQNAHTWDTVALALGVPLVAIDLPGHGHSDWRPTHDYWPASMAADVAIAVEQLAPHAKAVVGMSLGGLTAICFASNHPALVRQLGVVDVTPGTDHVKAEPIVAFVSGPEFFGSFDDILARTIEFNPTRSESSLRRGVLHNARALDDGRWSWRYDPMRSWKLPAGELASPGPERPERTGTAGELASPGPERPERTGTAGEDDTPRGPDFAPLWAEVDRVTAPITLYRGGNSKVVGDEDVAELVRRKPSTRVVVVDGAGHSIQGDKPVELAAHLRDLLV